MMICIPIQAQNTAEALEKMRQAGKLAGALEIRLDLMASFDLEKLLLNPPKPVVVTYRSQEEGGGGAAGGGEGVPHLLRALALKADIVDVEFGLPAAVRRRVMQARTGSRVMLSRHILDGTPASAELEDLLAAMAAEGPDLVKIVTRARSPEDNLRVLSLIPAARRLGVGIAAFCCGAFGRISRIACLLMGGALSFAALRPEEETADGQLTATEMTRIMEVLAP